MVIGRYHRFKKEIVVDGHFVCPPWDKFSGNSQKRTRRAVCANCTVYFFLRQCHMGVYLSEQQHKTDLLTVSRHICIHYNASENSPKYHHFKLVLQ